MSKVRTTISLNDANHDWLRARARSTGEMAELIDELIQEKRMQQTLEKWLDKQAERLAQAVTTAARN